MGVGGKEGSSRGKGSFSTRLEKDLKYSPPRDLKSTHPSPLERDPHGLQDINWKKGGETKMDSRVSKRPGPAPK